MVRTTDKDVTAVQETKAPKPASKASKLRQARDLVAQTVSARTRGRGLRTRKVQGGLDTALSILNELVEV